MSKKERIINVLLCIDDFSGNYTRHCAVTLLSLLETNRNNTLNIYILSSYLSEENQVELQTIVNTYDQQIFFIVKKDIIPSDIKNQLINRRNLTYAAFYRMFFSLHIKSIDRILYLDCDIIVNKDLWKLYSMDMHGKALVGYYDRKIGMDEKIRLGCDNYINTGVLLIDVGKYEKYSLTRESIEKINKKYGKYIVDVDQDYINIILKNDIFVGPKSMNCMIYRPFYNGKLYDAYIFHVIAKPYIQYSLAPKTVRQQYFKYLQKTKREKFPLERRGMNEGIYSYLYELIILILEKTTGQRGLIHFHRICGFLGKNIRKGISYLFLLNNRK